MDQPHWYGSGPHKTCKQCKFCDQCGPASGTTPCKTHPKKGTEQ